MNFLVIAAGGAAGALIRVLSSQMLAKVAPDLPWGTVCVNLVGSFLIGYLVSSFSLTYNQKLMILGGFLGSLTTMSTFSLDVVQLIEQKKWLPAIAFWSASAIGSPVVCAFSMWLGGQAK